MKAAHTPGPWIVAAGDWSDGGNARYELAGIKELRAADARLIASAPRVLRALATLADAVECLAPPKFMDPAVREAFGAIYEATGVEWADELPDELFMFGRSRGSGG